MSLKITTDERMIETRHYQKVCACGCGVVFGTNRPYAKFASNACRVRANRRKHAEPPQTILGVDLEALETIQIKQLKNDLEHMAKVETYNGNDTLSALLKGLSLAIMGKMPLSQKQVSNEANGEDIKSPYQQAQLNI